MLETVDESARTHAPVRDALTEPSRRRFGRLGRPQRRLGGLVEEGPLASPVAQRDRVYRLALVLADALGCTLAIAAMLAYDPHGVLNAWLLLVVPVVIAANKLAGLYERDALVLKKTTLDEAPALLQVSGLIALVVWMAHAELSEGLMRPQDVGLLWLGLLGSVLGGRVLARRIARAAAPPERCLVIGDPDSVELIQAKLRAPGLKAEIVAVVPLSESADVDAVARRPRQLLDLARRHEVHRVIIAPLASDAADTLELIRLAKATGLRVSVLPRMLEVVGSSIEFDHLEGVTMLGVRSFGLSRSSRFVKRAFDLAGSTALIALLSPLLAAIALAVKLDTRGPVLFCQVRVGRDGRRFRIFKFRSMVADAERRKEELRHLNETDGLFKIAKDPRVTRVGRLIRATSLDELPQLFNVWRGEMSLVGPRPLVVDEDALVNGLDRLRLHLTPGMTGHWQILGNTRVPLHEMVGIDYLYVANWTLWSDIKILLRTIPYVLARGGM